MVEENKNVQLGTQQSILRQETDAFNRTKALLKKKVSNDFALRRGKESEMLYEKSLTTTNENLCGQYDRACKASELARGARAYGVSKGYDWSNVEDIDLLNQYSSLFPESSSIMYDYLTHPQEDDPMPYYIKLGWEQPTEEDEATSWFKKAWDNFTWSFDKAGQGLRTMWNAANMYDRKGEFGAIQDYVYDTYGANASEEDWKNAERDLRLNPSLLDKYMSPTNAIKDTVMGGVVSAMNVTPLGFGINAGTSGVAATDIGETVFGTLGEGAETIGYYANKFPGLKQYRDSLPTEEDKREWDQFVGQELMALITRGAIKGYKEIKTVSNDSSFGGGLFKKFQENKRIKNQEQLQDTAGLIAKPKTVEEQGMATRALQDIDLEGVKDYVDMDVRFNERKSELINAENNEYANDVRKYKPEDTSEIKIYEMEGDKYINEGEWAVVGEGDSAQKVKYVTAKTSSYVQPMIKLLREFYSGNPEKMAKLELREQKFNTEGLTKAEINQLTRDIASEYESYTKRGKPKETIETQDVEGIRKTGKYFARGNNDTLINLDRKLSDNMNTQQMVKDLRDEIVRAKTTIAKKNLPQKVMSIVGDLLNVSGVKSLLFKLIPNAVGEEKISPLTRQKNLKSYIKKFESLNKKLNGAKTKQESQKIVEDFIKDVEKDMGPIEGEIISNETNWKEYVEPNNNLEEVVSSETVYPESKMLGDNGKNNVPIDFTTMPGIDPKGNVFKGFREVQEINNSNPK